jgi:hypothetical protein
LQYERAFQELALFRAHLAKLIGVNLDVHNGNTGGEIACETGEKSVLTESVNTQFTAAASPRTIKPTARQLTAELYKASTAEQKADHQSEYVDLLYLPMQQSMNNLSMVRLILASQLNTIRCFVEMEGGARIPVNILLRI